MATLFGFCCADFGQVIVIWVYKEVYTQYHSEVYSELSQRSGIELLAKIVNGLRALALFA